MEELREGRIWLPEETPLVSADSNEARTRAREKFAQVLRNKPSRQVLERFLTERADEFVRQHSHEVTRRDRKKITRDIVKRMKKQALAEGGLHDV